MAKLMYIESHRQQLHWLSPMVQNLVAPYVACELVGKPLYYGAWDFKNLFFWLLQG